MSTIFSSAAATSFPIACFASIPTYSVKSPLTSASLVRKSATSTRIYIPPIRLAYRLQRAIRDPIHIETLMQRAQQPLQTALQIALRVLLDRARAELVRLVQLRVLSNERILRQRLFDQPVVHVAQRVNAVQQPR